MPVASRHNLRTRSEPGKDVNVCIDEVGWLSAYRFAFATLMRELFPFGGHLRGLDAWCRIE